MSALQSQTKKIPSNAEIERFSFKAVNANYLMRRNPAEVWDSIDTRKQPENEMSDARKFLAVTFGFVHVVAALVCLYFISAQFMGFTIV
jgi:hypothetical protein